MKIEITSDKKLMRSSDGESQEGIELSKKERERNRLLRFRVGRRRTVYIENSEFRVAQYQSDTRHFKRLELLMGRSIDNVGGVPAQEMPYHLQLHIFIHTSLFTDARQTITHNNCTTAK